MFTHATQNGEPRRGDAPYSVQSNLGEHQLVCAEGGLVQTGLDRKKAGATTEEATALARVLCL
jgi:hypothetical protein